MSDGTTTAMGTIFMLLQGPIAGASLPVLAVGFGVYWLVLLCHKFRLWLRGKRRRRQHWHRCKVVAIATAMMRRIVAIELGTWRCGRIGGASGSVTTGKGRFFDASGGIWF